MVLGGEICTRDKSKRGSGCGLGQSLAENRDTGVLPSVSTVPLGLGRDGAPKVARDGGVGSHRGSLWRREGPSFRAEDPGGRQSHNQGFLGDLQTSLDGGEWACATLPLRGPSPLFVWFAGSSLQWEGRGRSL